MVSEQTSLDALVHVVPSLTSRRKLVFDALREGPANDRMLVERTGLAINCVTPRRGELVAKGLVVVDRVDACPFTGRKSTFWRVDGVL